MRTVIRTLVAGGLVAAAGSLAATASPQAVLEELRTANEGYAVPAVAAHETGNDEIYEKASRTAEKNGVDISALTDLRAD